MVAAIVVISCIVVAVLTYEFGQSPALGPIRASALVTLAVVYLVSPLLEPFIFPSLFQAAVFGASFVGMTSSSRMGRWPVGVAGAVFSALFLYLVPLLTGIGGALGFSAFLSVALVHSINGVTSKKRA